MGTTTLCACGAEATANGRECPPCYRRRLRSVSSGFAPSGAGGAVIDPIASRRLEGRLEEYRASRAEGIQPRTTRRSDVQKAKELSDRTGSAFRADAVARAMDGRA
jgi:hypothetical protein